MAYIGRDIQYGTFSKQSLTPDGSTVTFTLDQGVADATNLLLSNGGVIQEPNVAYTASGTTLTMSAAPAATDVIWITYLGKELTVVDTSAQSDLAFQVGTGDGSNVNPIATLDRVTPSAESIMVMTDGVTQVPGTDYTVNGTTLTFTTAPANGVKILVYFLGIAQNIGTVSDSTVTDSKIVGMSSSKLSGALPAIDGSALTNMPAELPAAGSSGNLLTSDGTDWASTAPADELPAAGSSGNVLTSDGTNWASTAAAGGGAWTFHGTTTASNSSSVALTGLDFSTYDMYAITLTNFTFQHSGIGVYIRLGDSNGYITSNDYSGSVVLGASDSNSSFANHAFWSTDGIWIGGSGGYTAIGGTGSSLNGTYYLSTGSSSARAMFWGHTTYTNESSNQYHLTALPGFRVSTYPKTIDRISFQANGGNLILGRMTVHGISHS